MRNDAPSYRGYRFPREIISHPVWIYVFINDTRQTQYLWRAVDQDGDVIDIVVTGKRPSGSSANR